MKGLTIRKIIEACHGQAQGCEAVMDQEITSVTTDSRKIEKGCLFVPIVGTRVDGHDFIKEVMSEGALAALTERKLDDEDFPRIQVESSLQAVKEIAAAYLDLLGIPVVAVTGSVGKTSTKEAIASVLSQKYKTLKTLGNFNNELGLPLTVFRLREEEIAVLELGINHFGEMTRLGKIARPDTAVITNIGTCHLEFLGDRDGVLRAKTELLPFVRENGHIVLNGNDDKLITVKEEHGIRPVFYGISEEKDASDKALPFAVWADDITDRGFDGTDVRIHVGEEAFVVHIPIPGRHMVSNALAACTVGSIYGLTAAEMKQGLEALTGMDGRFHVIETDSLHIVDDCYNASALSMKASLDILKSAAGRRVAILGDMGELGDFAVPLHREVGAYAVNTGADEVIFVGELAGHMYEAAKEAALKGELSGQIRLYHEPDVASLEKNMAGYLQKGDTVLVKASHFMHFEKIVEDLQALRLM